jgi:peptidoglycan/LPS O-acetylase OafA/YrhL
MQISSLKELFRFGPGTYRLLLALSVFVYHTSSIGFGSAPVYLFFMLSGYWMGKLWPSKYQHLNNPYRNFIASRFWRLMPLFIIASLFALLINRLIGRFPSTALQDLPPIPLSNVIISNLFIIGYDLLPFQTLVPAWSLDIEIQFYLLAPLIWASTQTLKLFGVLVYAAIGLLSVYFHIPFKIFGCLVFFHAGMLAASTQWNPSKKLAMSSLFIFSCMFLTFLAAPDLRQILIGGAHKSAQFIHWNPILNLFFVASLTPFTIWTTHQNGGKHDRSLGDISYAIYLLHPPLTIVLGVYYGHIPPTQRIPYVFCCLVLTLALSFLAWRYIDRPMIAARERHSRRALLKMEVQCR